MREIINLVNVVKQTKERKQEKQEKLSRKAENRKRKQQVVNLELPGEERIRPLRGAGRRAVSSMKAGRAGRTSGWRSLPERGEVDEPRGSGSSTARSLSAEAA